MSSVAPSANNGRRTAGRNTSPESGYELRAGISGRSRRGMVAAASVVVAATVGALVNLLTGGAHSWLLFTLAASAVGFLAAIEWWRNVSPGETLRSRLRSVPTLRDAVPRSDETQRVIRQLLAKGGGSVGITTALSGAGGFGKTTLARMVATDPAVRRRFPNQVEIVLGKDVLGANLAGKINDLIHLIAGETTSFTDPQVAGQRLGQLLDTGPGTLLLVDDVWSSAQVRPFVAGGARCALLFTTRIPSILPVGTPTVTVDQMSPAECVALLTGSVPGLSRDHATGLSEATGRWPLLLSLTNGALRAAVEAGEEANASAAGILRRLAEIGPEALDVSVGGSRELAAKATIEIGTDLLGDGGAERLEELGIFPEVCYTDSRMTAVVTDTEGQWVATVGNTGVLRFWTEHSRRFRRRVAPANNATIAVAPNGDWIATAVPGGYDVSVYRIPNGRPVADLHIIPTVSIGGLIAPDSAHVTVVDNGHLITFDLHGGYTWLPYSAGNHTGPSTAAPVDDDLIAIGCHDGTVLVVDRGDGTCLVRIDAHFGQVTALVAPPDGTWIASAGTDKTIRIWDTGDGRPRASFLGHTGTVHTMAVAPDGTWLASAGEDSDVRLWDVESGRLPAEGSLAARSVAVAVDGSVVVTAGHDDALVRTWQTTTGSLAETQSVPQRLVRDKDLEPYQQILAVEMARGRDADALGDAAKRMVAHAKWNSLSRLAVASGADILAAVDRDGLVMVVEGARPPTMPPGPPEDGVDHLALSADGTILVTVARSSHGRGARVKAWNSGTLLGIGGTYLHGGSDVTAIGFDSDGRRVLLGLDDGTIAEWHFTSGVATHSGHEAAVRGIAYDDRGHRWATVGEDGAVRIWTTDLRECLAMIRTDGPLADCAWLIDDDTVVAVGARGIYGFDLLTDSGHTGSRSRPQ